jgi:hypothetical protein
MPLEDSEFISELNPAWPLGTDGVNTSDDQHRNTKGALVRSFPNIDAEVTASSADLNLLAGAALAGSGLNPTGTVLMFYGDLVADGYLLCNGGPIPVELVDLIALVGANTPDLQGQFVRGWSADALVDPDGPRAAGSIQADQVGPHSHPIQGHNSGGSESNRIVASSGVPTATATTLNSPGIETRPKNMALAYMIKW